MSNFTDIITVSGMQTAKILGIWAFIGVVVMGLIAVGVSEYDGYYDDLLVVQSLVLGLFGGVVVGASVLVYQSHRSKIQPVWKSPPNVNQYSEPGQAKINDLIGEKKQPIAKHSLWSQVWRWGLSTVVGLVFGFIISVICCIYYFNELTPNEQAWGIFYVPVLVIYIIIGTSLGTVGGAVLGSVWGSIQKK